MDMFNILAYVAEGEITTGAANSEVITVQHEIIPIDWIWSHITHLGIVEALTFISFGLVCLLYGWRVFKILAVISFALIGLFLGITIGDILGGSATAPILGLLCCVALGIGTIPMMQVSVSILGAAAGGLISGGIWYAFGLPEQFIWAGALVGLVAGGMISFIVFKVAVMLFSGLGGSALILVASLALIHMYEPTSAAVKNLVFNEAWFLPLALTVPTIIGVFVQNKLIKGSQDWSI